ncbi:MAG: hypothetical protein H0X46_02285 [Bacteroidetes bacterium]|nr:hypothetical protein [Bacteroidota bacterium]
MGAVGFMSLGVLFLMALPLITSRFAKRMGRNPKTWFLIGIVLRVISKFILLFLPDLSEEKKVLHFEKC